LTNTEKTNTLNEEKSVNKRYIFMGFLTFVSLIYVYGINVNLEINGIEINSGKIYLTTYSN
jgi:hypothetical protein